MNTSARPCCCARRDCAVHISSSPFSKGTAFRMAGPASIGATVGKRINRSGKRPKNIIAKYKIPITSKRQVGGRILGLNILQATKHTNHEKGSEVRRLSNSVAVHVRRKPQIWNYCFSKCDS